MSVDSYRELAELAEAQLAHCEAGETEQLEALYERSQALAATLPEAPPAAARPQLERAAAAQQRIERRLDLDLATTRARLDHLRRGRDAARSYGASARAGGGAG